MLTDLGMALPVAVACTIKPNGEIRSLATFLGELNDAVNKFMEQSTPAAFGFYTVLTYSYKSFLCTNLLNYSRNHVR